MAEQRLGTVEPAELRRQDQRRRPVIRLQVRARPAGQQEAQPGEVAAAHEHVEGALPGSRIACVEDGGIRPRSKLLDLAGVAFADAFEEKVGVRIVLRRDRDRHQRQSGRQGIRVDPTHHVDFPRIYST